MNRTATARFFAPSELAEIRADEREQEIWGDLDQLGDVLNMVRGPLDFSTNDPDRQQGRDTLTLLQRAYNAKTDAQRREFARLAGERLYDDLVDFAREQAVSP